MKLVDLKLSPKDKKERSICSPAKNADPYGYGTRVSFDKEQVAKVFGDELPKVGDVFTIEATASVVSTSKSEGTDYDSTRVELQFKKIGVEKQAKSALAAVSKGIAEAKDA